jgi:hypothetical protein
VAVEVRAGDSVEHLVQGVREAILRARSVPETVRGVRDALQQLLDNPAFVDQCAEHLAPRGYAAPPLYKDPELDFVITAGGGRLGVVRPPYDHGDWWAVFGIFVGAIGMRRFRLLTPIPRWVTSGPAEVEQIGEFTATPGRIDNILPGHIHELTTIGDRDAISVIVRCHDLQTVWRNIYDLEAKTFRRIRGSEQAIPVA